MGNGIDRFAATLQAHLATTVLAVLVALAVVCVVVGVVRAARRRGVTGEQAGTLVAAAIATGVSAQGMWVFFDRSLHLTLSLRIMFFAFLEIMVLTSALRARSAQQVSGSAGIDGIAMWVLTCLSAVLAATDADNLGTVLIRLSAPLVAAWGWERSMALERRRSGVGGINWRITPERILIRLGFADPTDRTAGEAAQQRRLIDVALAADRARTLRDTGAGTRRVNRARRRLQKTMRRAVDDGGLVDNARSPRAVLLDNLRILSSTGALLDLDLPNPWTSDEDPESRIAAAFSGAPAGARVPALSADAVHSGSLPMFSAHATQSPNPADSTAQSPNPAAQMAPPLTPAVHTTPPLTPAAHSTPSVTPPFHAAQPLTRPAHPTQPLPLAAQTVQSAYPAAPSEQSSDSPESQAIPPTAPAFPPTMPLPIAALPAPDSQNAASAAQSATPDYAHPAGPTTPAESAMTTSAVPPSSGVPATPDQSSSPAAPLTPESTMPTPATAPEPDLADTTSTPQQHSPAPRPTPPQSQRQYRRDPAVRDRVRAMRAANISVTDIAAELGTSTRTISRILRDLDAESPATQELPVRPAPRNLAQAAVSSWHNGFRVLPGGNGNTAAASGLNDTATEERPDRSIEN